MGHRASECGLKLRVKNVHERLARVEGGAQRSLAAGQSESGACLGSTRCWGWSACKRREG